MQHLSDALRPWRGTYPEVHAMEDAVLLSPEVALAHASGNCGLVVVGRRYGGRGCSAPRAGPFGPCGAQRPRPTVKS